MTTIEPRPYNNSGWSESDIAEVDKHLSAIAALPEVKTILEIGSAHGTGSTAAIVRGMALNTSRPTLCCIEANPDCFFTLASHYILDKSVICICALSVEPDKYISKDLILKEAPEGIWNLCINWQQEQKIIAENDLRHDGIAEAKSKAGVEVFDFVYIDSSYFSADEELNQTYGAKYIAMDDVNDIKCRRTHARLVADPNYQEIIREYRRNVWALFKKL